MEFTPLDLEFIAARRRHAAREDAQLDAQDAALPAQEPQAAEPFAYRPPIESVCAHGKTIGPCAFCGQQEQQDQRDALGWQSYRDE